MKQKVLRPFKDKSAIGDSGFMFYCEGCESCHAVWTGQPNELTGAKWGFNGDLIKPTFTPSILVRWGYREDGGQQICHSFVTDGEIKFLNDCTHDLAGRTLPLPKIDTW